MTIRLEGPRRAAFFGALKATGNITLAAERAKLGREWVRRRRRLDSAFDDACRAAIAAALDTLGMRDDFRPPSGWGHLDGAELAVRGAPGRRVQIRRARLHGWSPAVEDRFLALLGATCNVKAACAEIGLTQASAYYHRRQWPAFAERWGAALGRGFMRLEFALIENACNLFSGDGQPEDMPMPPMAVSQAIHLAHMYKHLRYGRHGRPGPPIQPASREEASAEVLRLIEAVKRGERIPKAQKARDEREWRRRRAAS